MALSERINVWSLTVSQCFSASKEEVPDNEQEKGTEKEMAERVNEETEIVRLKASCFIFMFKFVGVSPDIELFICNLLGGPGRQWPRGRRGGRGGGGRRDGCGGELRWFWLWVGWKRYEGLHLVSLSLVHLEMFCPAGGAVHSVALHKTNQHHRTLCLGLLWWMNSDHLLR